MNKTDLKKVKLPDTPGVYFFLGNKKEILYIGKATSLKNRVTSYFSNDLIEKRSPIIDKMVKEAKSLEYTVTDSVLEALILEANLIRTHKPRFNTLGKDQKSYNHLVITNEEYPRVLIVRGKDLLQEYTEDQILHEFGPFTSGVLLKEALKIIKKLFKFYDTKVPVGSEKSKLAKGKIAFNRQIGLYPEEGQKEEYLKTIKHIVHLFQGKKQKVISELKNEMEKSAKLEKFEEASILKKKIFALNHIQDISLIKKENFAYRDDNKIRIEAYDIAHMAGDSMVGVMTVIEGEEVRKSEYRKFKIQSVAGPNDTASLREVLVRRLSHAEWPLPQIIVVDGSTAQKNTAEKVLREKKLVIPVIGVVKDKKHKPVRIIGVKRLIENYKDQILLSNSEAHRFAISYHRQDIRKKKIR